MLLFDVSVSGSVEGTTQEKWEEIFQSSRWFKRGWTLQELLAARSVDFSKYGVKIGVKMSLQKALQTTTGLPKLALENSALSQFSVVERFSWAERRDTKREEDAAYSLLGIFDIQIPLIYGEGQDKASKRLQREIEGVPEVQTDVHPRPMWTLPFGCDPDFIDQTA